MPGHKKTVTYSFRVLTVALASVFFQDSSDEWSGKRHSVTKRSPDAADRAKERRTWAWGAHAKFVYTRNWGMF